MTPELTPAHWYTDTELVLVLGSLTAAAPADPEWDDRKAELAAQIKRRRRIDGDAEHARRVLGQLGARVVPMS